MYDNVLFPTDGSEGAAVALDHALNVAENYGATLHFLNVANTDRTSVTGVGDQVVDALERAGEDAVADAADSARGRGLDTVEAVLRGDPSDTIVDYASDRGVDLIVMATHGRRGLDRFLMGSVTEKVVRAADVPVLTVRMDDAD